MNPTVLILAIATLSLSACTNEEAPAPTVAIPAKAKPVPAIYQEQFKALEKAKGFEKSLVDKDKKLREIIK